MSDKDLIDQLGGASELAKRIGTTTQRVQNWKARGIPPKIKLQFPAIFLPNFVSNDGSSQQAEMGKP